MLPPELWGAIQQHNTLKTAKKKEAPEYPALLKIKFFSGFEKANSQSRR